MDNPTYSAPFQPVFHSKPPGARVTPLSKSVGSLYASAGSVHIPSRSIHGSAGNGLHISAKSFHGSGQNVCSSAINISCGNAARTGIGSTRNRVCTSTNNIFGSGRASKSQCELLRSLDNPLYGIPISASANRKVMSAEHLLDNSLRVHSVPDEDEKNDYDDVAIDEYDFPFNPEEISNTEPCPWSCPNSGSYLTTSTLLSTDSEHIYEFTTSSTAASTRVSIYSDAETASHPLSQEQELLPKSTCD